MKDFIAPVNKRVDNGRIINCPYNRMGTMSTNGPSIIQKFKERVDLHSLAKWLGFPQV